MFGLTFRQAQSGFFDRKAVKSRTDKASHRVLSKFGAFVRTSARGSIRKRKKAAPPGRPPSSHTGLLKKFIFFSYDRQRKSVVIGPTNLNIIYYGGHGEPKRGTVPSVLEHGGQIGILEVFKWGKWQRMDHRSIRRNAGLERRIRTVNIEARPFMGPAFRKEQEKLPQLWRNAIK